MARCLIAEMLFTCSSRSWNWEKSLLMLFPWSLRRKEGEDGTVACPVVAVARVPGDYVSHSNSSNGLAAF
jgi:hypothetical protein